MNVDLSVLLILIFVIAPASLLFHEIGHAFGAKWMGASSVEITIGAGKKVWEGTIKNIRIAVRRVFFANSHANATREKPFKKREKIIISFCGPFFSGLSALIFFIGHYSNPSVILYIFGLFNIWLAIVNLLPLKIGQKESDGYTICKLLLKKRT